MISYQELSKLLKAATLEVHDSIVFDNDARDMASSELFLRCSLIPIDSISDDKGNDVIFDKAIWQCSVYVPRSTGRYDIDQLTMIDKIRKHFYNKIFNYDDTCINLCSVDKITVSNLITVDAWASRAVSIYLTAN